MSFLKVVAIESSRERDPSLNGDLRKQLCIVDGDTVHLRTAAGVVGRGTARKVDLSTARLAEFAVARGLAAGFIFLPRHLMSELRLQSGQEITVSSDPIVVTSAPSASAKSSSKPVHVQTAVQAAVKTPMKTPTTKAGMILNIVHDLNIGDKIIGVDVIAAVKGRFKTEVDADRVRSVLSEADCVVVSKSTVGRGNVYERVEYDGDKAVSTDEPDDGEEDQDGEEVE